MPGRAAIGFPAACCAAIAVRPPPESAASGFNRGFEARPIASRAISSSFGGLSNRHFREPPPEGLLLSFFRSRSRSRDRDFFFFRSRLRERPICADDIANPDQRRKIGGRQASH